MPPSLRQSSPKAGLIKIWPAYSYAALKKQLKLAENKIQRLKPPIISPITPSSAFALFIPLL